MRDKINEEDKLKKIILEKNISAEHIRYNKSLHSVKELLEVTGLPLELITKTMIFKNSNQTIAAMVPAKFRVSSALLGKALGILPPEIASPKEAYEQTGFPVGGMPCFGYDAVLVIDPKVLEQDFVYTGGGSEFSIVKISREELIKLAPLIKKIVGNKSN